MLNKNKEEIIDRLTKYLNDYPELRFCQALYNLGIVENIEIKELGTTTLYSKDHFYDEDSLVIKRMDRYNYNG